MSIKKPTEEQDEYNRQSLITLNKKNPRIIPSNPEFFEVDTMQRFGYQNFDVMTTGNKEYLTVDRSIIHNERKIELNTSVYELDEKSVITKITGSIRKKITSVLPSK